MQIMYTKTGFNVLLFEFLQSEMDDCCRFSGQGDQLVDIGAKLFAQQLGQV